MLDDFSIRKYEGNISKIIDILKPIKEYNSIYKEL